MTACAGTCTGYLQLVMIGALVGAAWLDYRTRRVSNRYWIWVLVVASPALVYELATAPMAFAIRLAAAAAFAAAAFALWLGRAYQGGDAKGLMLLGLLGTPVGYWDPAAGRMLPVLDALPVALLAGEAWRRLRHTKSVPFFVPLLPVFTVTLYRGGLLWHPVLWLVGLLV